ncbi:choice-of-anchor M domain-containing protein [Corynebacterium accolens]|uniref:choice-of-anchor M domain-containing protein n=1 Tax=Corynebacterium accolens TaxID=38284 RepID=UPI00254EA310|nr:choice-of-anchor M domain-containing protein [Corynebacterium accolens]MDK8471726.1 choice-of-anchor M domain-containing protein [Corynebacterium accolens]MDK8617756.1 choice-of-anchor M domain-containing protein [Corynebacterium accolens]MDK8681056.1 choice-of-anchor M domain-containing protein [Corynebacterium accolens]
MLNFATRPAHRATTRMAACVLTAGLALSTSPAWAGDLAQVVSADESVAPEGEEKVIDSGHVDVGTLLDGDDAELLARDDAGDKPVWRHLDDLVFSVGDAAQQPLPDTDDFDFVGADSGSEVWVVPQTEQVGVPWLGWNTQAPSLVDNADRGVTMEFLGHSGPGDFSLFLQNGGFEAPQLLWSTAAKSDKEFWVDLNTHTHANWTFTEPGVHQVGIRVKGTTNEGKDFSTDGILTFAVGDNTDVNEAQNASWSAEEATTADSSIPSWVYILVGVGAIVLVLGLVVALRSRKRGDGRA